MAIRNDFTIDWELSPRVITIAAPSIECTMQDLLDTLRSLESKTSAMDNPSIVDASGKEVLDATTKVGITVTLQNAVVGFEARSGPDWTICSFVGGNLVSVNNSGNTVESVNPTAFVTVKAQSSSSATLQEQDALQYSSYGGQVSVNATATHPYAEGVDYPSGNMEYPVNNAANAVTICHNKGFHTIGLSSNYGFIAGDDVSDLKIQGISHITTIVDIGYDAICHKAIFDNIEIAGILDGESEISNCVVRDIVYFNGHIHHSALAGRITLGGNKPAKITECSMLEFRSPVIIDAGGSGQDLVMDKYSGGIVVENLTGDNYIGLSMSGGMVTIASDCTAGTIIIQGNFELTDNSGAGCTVIINEKIMVQDDIAEIAEAVVHTNFSCP